MKLRRARVLSGVVVLLAAVWLPPASVRAHCDGLDGPVVKAAREALETGDVNRVLTWVRQQDEPEIRIAFERALAVRELAPQARALAESYFYETLVRLHRAGEGVAYTGLKPAGRDLGPAIPLADKGLEAESVEPLVRHLAIRSSRPFPGSTSQEEFRTD